MIERILGGQQVAVGWVIGELGHLIEGIGDFRHAVYYEMTSDHLIPFPLPLTRPDHRSPSRPRAPPPTPPG